MKNKDKKLDEKRLEKIDPKTEVIFLRITSHTGLSLMAEHYYAKLINYDHSVEEELTRKITEPAEARHLSKKCGVKSAYRVGSVVNCFTTIKHVKEEARKQYKKIFPKARMILIGDCSILNPIEVLMGPRYLKTVLNRCWKAYEQIRKLEDKYNIPDKKLLPMLQPIESIWDEIWKFVRDK